MAPHRITPWTADEVQTFLRLVADDRIQHQLHGAARNAKVYKEVAALLAVRGYQRTYLQCREKLKKLKSDYRSIKEQKHGSNRKNWRWFEQLDAIYGDKPASGGRTRLHDTVAGMLDALMEDGKSFCSR
ncbi:uncharacterized protein [Brachyistius frenatus]|uniref:uncharacterized protein n=1 Tax=Brachyistius frenatus TaxID=100188 RepID=UPI0037E7A064